MFKYVLSSVKTVTYVKSNLSAGTLVYGQDVKQVKH